MMFKHLIEENGVKEEMKKYGLNIKDDVTFIGELIMGQETCTGRDKDKKGFLAEVL